MSRLSKGTWSIAKASCCAMLYASALSGCNQKPIVGPVLVLDPSATMSRQVGHFDSTDKAIVALPGEKGFVVFGPYAELAPGFYQVTFHLSVEGAQGVAGHADVNEFTAGKVYGVLAAKDLHDGSGQKLALDFTAKAGPKYEFRVATDGNATIRVLGIVVKRHS